MTAKIQKIHFEASDALKAKDAYIKFVDIYGDSTPEEADVIVVFGGDGFMLHNLYKSIDHGKPVYGMNCGSVGFLMNEYCEYNLLDRLASSVEHIFHPLRMVVFEKDSVNAEIFAINEVSLLRQSFQAAKLKVIIDNQVRLHELVCDGLIVSTPVGSTAYNLSAYGPILPLDSPLLALTPVSPFSPRRWRGALLPNNVIVEVHVLDAKSRPVSATADHTRFEYISRIQVSQFTDATIRILSDPNRSWSDRIMAEQFPV
ncbi:NAD kinase [Candidatus Liberibacter americanus]|uniref:NAD kinase n=1 Tax=Candidatus Liberibacter americanus str. Sao Paulo TaxID=1261131 RepID=U6B4M4_9HYPH|nr:NAD kinase [Candidatus Liberibacter americanus]AHA27578.1 putative kinase [Candidatus Liberibacter americanus str. Sao Paulo]EMS36461.1 inorganic polyphosphate/ATP-NAD kinase [Candidatus Liberibacter americanus PW_SP]